MDLLHIIETQINKFLNNMFSSIKPVATVKKEIKYFSLPYYSPEFEKLADSLKRFIEKSYPQLQIQFSLSNPFTIASFFRTKGKPFTELLSNIIYKFTYEDCNVSFIGGSHRISKCRIDQHLGISSRLGRRLATVMHSLPKIHAETFNHKIHVNNFSIIDYFRNIQDLPGWSLFIS